MKSRLFTMEFGPTSVDAKVLLDGVDITSMLRNVSVKAGIDGATTVHLEPVQGQRVNLVVALPEASVTIGDEKPLSPHEDNDE